MMPSAAKMAAENNLSLSAGTGKDGRIVKGDVIAALEARAAALQTARAQILNVGAQLEPINPALLAVDSKRVEVGLPIVVAVPDGIHLVPGEYINLLIDYDLK